jgi:hypothetical protein
MCVFIVFPKLSGTIFFATHIQQHITINALSSPSKVPVILVRLQLTLNFLETFSENSQASISMKSHPEEPSFFMRTDGCTDRWRERRVEADSRFP